MRIVSVLRTSLDCFNAYLLTNHKQYILHISDISMGWQQDKNRDVIVAFPDVHPSAILMPEISEERSSMYFSQQLPKRRGSQKEIIDSYEKPHLWYSTSDVIRALVLFLENGDELSECQTFRWYVHLCVHKSYIFLLEELSLTVY